MSGDLHYMLISIVSISATLLGLNGLIKYKYNITVNYYLWIVNFYIITVINSYTCIGGYDNHSCINAVLLHTIFSITISMETFYNINIKSHEITDILVMVMFMLYLFQSTINVSLVAMTIAHIIKN